MRVDNQQVVQLVFEHFHDRGLRHFAFVGHSTWLYSTLREQLFRKHVEAAGYTLHVYHTRNRQEFDPLARIWPADRGVLPWLVRLPKPIGLLVPNDLWGVQIIELCRASNIRVPEEIAILGVDNDKLLCAMSRPPLSSVALPTWQIGFEAARLVDRLIDGESSADRQILLSPVGVETRPSTDVLATDDQDVVAAIRYIRENAHRPIRVVDVLREIPVSRRRLELRFRRVLKRTIGAEIRRVHMERAKQLLANSDLPLAAIALRSGFSGARQLCVVFRQETGSTPIEYRRGMRVAHAND